MVMKVDRLKNARIVGIGVMNIEQEEVAKLKDAFVTLIKPNFFCFFKKLCVSTSPHIFRNYQVQRNPKR